MIITLTLNPSVDYILQVDEIRSEDTLRAKQAVYEAGGKGINVSRVLTRLGVDNQAWGFCGGCTGEWLSQFLDNEQVAHDFVETPFETRINTIITEIPTHKQIRVSAPGQEIQPETAQKLIDRVASLQADTGWLVMGGSIPPGMKPDIYRQLIETANQKGISCLLDADGQSFKSGLMGRPRLIKPNQYELQRLVGQPLETQDAIVQAAQQLVKQDTVEIVVVSLAEQGAVMVTQDTVLFGKAPKVEVKSKVGAGDSMVAGLVYGFYKKLPLEDILKHGIAAGTAAVMTGGTELCIIGDMNRIYPQIHVEGLVAAR